MEDGPTTKLELIRPVFHKAGIPIAFSVAGFIFARICTPRKPESHSTAIKITNLIELEDEENCSREDDINSLPTKNMSYLEEQILRVNANLQDLHSKELELESRFTHLCDLKNQEMELLELGKCLLLEIARTESLHRELLSIEAESKRFEEMVSEFQKLMEQLQYFRLENGMLHRRITRILRKERRRSGVICKRNLQIEVGRAEILQNRQELERRANRINVLECRIVELEMSGEKLQEDKDQVLNKLDMPEKSAASLSQLELGFRGNEEVESDNGDSRIGCTNPSHSKRPRLIEKLKRWVGGSEKTKRKSIEKEMH